jgi:hypothetical protein
VIAGDIPPAYLVCDDAPTWFEALDGYVREMERWVSAVRSGDSLAEVIPVNAEPSIEHADMLASRLQFIREQILAYVDDSACGNA